MLQARPASHVRQGGPGTGAGSQSGRPQGSHADDDSDNDDADFEDALDGLPSLTVQEPDKSSKEDIDAPPAFPALNGPQRTRAAAPAQTATATPAPTRTQMPAPSFTVSGPSIPASRAATKTSTAGASEAAPTPSASAKMASLRQVLGVPAAAPSAAPSSGPSSTKPPTESLLMPPPRTTPSTAPAGVGGASGALLPPPSSLAAARGNAAGGLGVPAAGPAAASSGETKSSRKKVVLEPGYGPLDWARLKSSSAHELTLRAGFTTLRRIPLSELKMHNTEADAWSAFNGKVYNLTPYLKFHPGGVPELMRVAGRDGTRLFSELVHGRSRGSRC